MDKVERERRHQKVRRKVFGTSERPRLAVFRSNQHIYAQLIDDSKGVTLAFESDIKGGEGKKTERAVKVGEGIAKKALSKKIKRVVFDRAGFKYHGRIAAVAEGARRGGLEF